MNGRGGASGTSTGGVAGTIEVAIDPDGVCSPPCGVMLEEPPPDVVVPPAGALVATLFYEIEAKPSNFERARTHRSPVKKS